MYYTHEQYRVVLRTNVGHLCGVCSVSPPTCTCGRRCLASSSGFPTLSWLACCAVAVGQVLTMDVNQIMDGRMEVLFLSLFPSLSLLEMISYCTSTEAVRDACTHRKYEGIYAHVVFFLSYYSSDLLRKASLCMHALPILVSLGARSRWRQ